MHQVMIGSLFDKLWDFIFPHRCVACRAWAEDWLCAPCLAAQAPPALQSLTLAHIDRAYYFWPYAGHVKSALHLIKFQRRKYLAKKLSRYMQSILESELTSSDYDFIVPAPLHWRKLFWRGFNQTSVLFEDWLSSRSSQALPLLRRQRFTRPLYGLSKAERERELKGVFALVAGFENWIPGKKLLLLDDILTTGATVSEMGRLLKAAGARQVDALALAYTPLKSGK
jgi:ComF family protein